MAGKVSQDAIEAAVKANPNVRVSQAVLEVIYAKAATLGRVDQLVVEVAQALLRQAVIDQLVVEVAGNATGTSAARGLVDQLAVEVAAAGSPRGLVDQLVVEVARAVSAQALVAQAVVEVAYLAAVVSGGTRRRVVGGWVG